MRKHFFLTFLLLALFAALLSSCGGKSGGSPDSGLIDIGGDSVRAFGIAVSEDGSKLYMPNNIRGEIFEMNSSTLKTSRTFSVSQRPRLLRLDPQNDWLLVSYENQCVGSTNTDCMYFTALNVSDGSIEIEAIKTSDAIGKQRTFDFVASKTVYIANGECRQDSVAGKTDTGALYSADLTGPTGATVSINVISSSKFNTADKLLASKSFFGTAVSEDESTLYFSRGCCTYVCTTTEIGECAEEDTCVADCNEKFSLSSQATEKLDCKESCYQSHLSCARTTTSACPTPAYPHTCPKKCGSGGNAGSCATWENKILHFNTATLTENTNSPIDLSSNCNGASYMTMDETRERLYVSCGNANKVAIVDISTATPTVSTVSVGATPANLAISADGAYLFVSNQNADTVSMINLTSKTVVKTITVGDFPAGIAEYYPYIYVTNVLNGSVSKINYLTVENARVAAPILPDFR